MSKYFLESKNRLILLLLTWSSTVFVSYSYKETLLFHLIEPSISKSVISFYFIFTNVTEIFSIYLELILFLGLQFFWLYLLFHTFLFLSPAFFKTEYLYIKFSLKIIVLGWVVSIILIIYILIPITWDFFLSYRNFTVSQSFNIYFEPKIKEFFNFFFSFYSLYNFYFQFLLIFLLFLNITRISIKAVKKFRKSFYFCFAILLVLVSSSEVFTYICMNIIIVIIYEIFIIITLIKVHF